MRKIKSVRLGVTVEKLRELNNVELDKVAGGYLTQPTQVNGETAGCKYQANHNAKRLR